MRTERRLKRSSQAVLPFELCPNMGLARANGFEPPIGIEPMTYALRASPVFDGGGWSVSSSAEVCRAVYVWQRLVMGGWRHVRGKRAPTRAHQAVEFIGFAWGEDDDALDALAA